MYLRLNQDRFTIHGLLADSLVHLQKNSFIGSASNRRHRLIVSAFNECSRSPAPIATTLMVHVAPKISLMDVKGTRVNDQSDRNM